MKVRQFITMGMMTLCLTACGGLPTCNSAEAKKLVAKIINEKSYLLGKFVELKDIQETAFNRENEIRMCTAELTTTHGTEDINFSIRWQDKDSGNFYIEVR